MNNNLYNSLAVGIISGILNFGVNMKKVLIVVDMINDFVTGKLGSDRARKIVPNIFALVKKAKKQGIPVIYLRDAHTPIKNWVYGESMP